MSISILAAVRCPHRLEVREICGKRRSASLHLLSRGSADQFRVRQGVKNAPLSSRDGSPPLRGDDPVKEIEECVFH